MNAKPTIHPMAAQHLRELRERWAVEPDLEEAIWIIQLCDKVLSPAGDRTDLCGVPVRVGVSEVWLWPMTIGAAIFVQDKLDKWWGGSTQRQTMALAWTLAHARDPEAIREATRGRDKADKLIGEWESSLACTAAELEAALDILLPPPVKDDADDKAKQGGETNWPQVIRELEAATGMPADHWTWEMSRSQTVSAWHASRAVIAAKGGQSVPRSLSEVDMALQDLAEAKAAIIEAHRVKASKEGASNEQGS